MFYFFEHLFKILEQFKNLLFLFFNRMLFDDPLNRCIKIVLNNPHALFSVRSLSKKAKVSIGTAHKALKIMRSLHLVKFHRVGPTYQHTVNQNNYLTKYFKILLNLVELQQKLFNQLSREFSDAYAILLYGSYADGTNDEKSDIDILIITDKKKKIPQTIFKKVKAEVNILQYTWKEWRQLSKTNKAFYESVIDNSIIILGEKPVVKIEH